MNPSCWSDEDRVFGGGGVSLRREKKKEREEKEEKRQNKPVIVIYSDTMQSSLSSSSSSSCNNVVKEDQSKSTLSPTGEKVDESVSLPASILRSLECSLCLTIICEPISISCGHSFCRVCLVKSLRRHKKR